MAYKSTTLYASYGAYYGFSVSFTENSTSTPNNTSNITCSASIWSENRSGWSAGSNSTLTVYWHDNRENYDRYVSSISFSGVGVGETKTASGLFIPEAGQEKTQTATVVEVGPGTEDEKVTVKIGDRIMYDKYAGTEIKIDDEEHLILRMSDIIAIIEK